MKWTFKHGLRSLLLALSLSLWPFAAYSDYWLVTVNLDKQDHEQYYGYDVLSMERFIGFYYCRDRGYKNQDMLKNVDVRAGFACVSEKEKRDATEDAPISESS